jgi:hypothetical protein
MRVSIVKSGHDRGATRVDDAGGGRAQLENVRVRANSHDTAAANRDRLGDRVACIDRVDASVMKD